MVYGLWFMVSGMDTTTEWNESGDVDGDVDGDREDESASMMMNSKKKDRFE